VNAWMYVHERRFFQTLRNTIDIDEVVENIETEENWTAITESETTTNIIELEDLSTKIKSNNENALNLRKNATKN
jgi:hypothetical protein